MSALKPKTCSMPGPKPCRLSIALNDPHDRCLPHNVTCWQDYFYDPRNCEACGFILGSYTASAEMRKVFTRRMDTMAKNFTWAATVGKRAKISDDARRRFAASKGKDFWHPDARHLDPRCRSKSPASRPVTPAHIPVEAVLQPGSSADESLPAPATVPAVTPGTPLPTMPPTCTAPPGPSEMITMASPPKLPPAGTSSPQKSGSRNASPSSSSSSSSEEERSRKRHKKKRKRRYSSSSSSSASSRRRRKRRRARSSSRDTKLDALTSSVASLSALVDSLSKRVIHQEASQRHAAPGPSSGPSVPQLDRPESVVSLPIQEDDFYEEATARGNEEPEEEYDPSNASASYPLPGFRSQTDSVPPPSLSGESGQPGHYLFPDGTSFSHDRVSYDGHEIMFNSQQISMGSYNKEPTFAPLCDSEAVAALIQDGFPIGTLETPESTAQHKLSIFKAISNSCVTHLGFRKHPCGDKHLTIDKPSRFVASLPKTFNPKAPFKKKELPFSILPASQEHPGSLALFSYAFAPKLSRDCHLLPGILDGLTSEIPDSLRQRDFESRQNLANFLFLHEFAKFSSNVSSSNLREINSMPHSRPAAIRCKSLGRVADHVFAPLLQLGISNALNAAYQVRSELRCKALEKVSHRVVLTLLRDGEIAVDSLFCPSSISNATEVYKQQNIVVIGARGGRYNPAPSSAVPTTSSGLPRSLPQKGATSSFRSKPRGPSSHSVPRSSLSSRAKTQSYAPSKGFRGFKYQPRGFPTRQKFAHPPSKKASRANPPRKE